MSLLYGRRVWASAPTAIVLASVMLVTGALIVYDTLNTDQDYFSLEFTEVPLMAAMFLAMVGYARRREAALAEVGRLADINAQMLTRERAFVRDAVHELRAPITIARGHAELMRLGSGVSNERDVVVVLDELSSLSAISERMLAGALSDGSEQLRLMVFDGSALVNGAGLRWVPTVKRRWTITAPRTAPVLGDRGRLQAALDALIENALAFTGADDRIEVSSVVVADEVHLIVADSGSGIAADRVQHLFDRLRLPEGRRARNGEGGTGLGLPIVKTIVEAHGGTISVQSELGVGSTFTIRLPRVRMSERRTIVRRQGRGGRAPLAVAHRLAD
jgi:two-component system OmpR family sensor kinase